MGTKKGYQARSIQSQLLYRLLIGVIIMLTVLGVYQYSNMKTSLYASKVELLDSRFKNINKKVIVGTTTHTLLQQNMEYILNQISGEEIGVAVMNQEGEMIAAKNRYTGIMTEMSKRNEKMIQIPKLSEAKYQEALSDGRLASGYEVVTDSEGQRQLVILREIGEFTRPIGLVQISTYMTDVEHILAEQARMYILSAIAVLVVGSILGIAVLRHTLKPLKQMTNQLDQIDSDQLDIRIEAQNGQIEIDILANKFNNMFERLEKSFTKEKKMNEAMKHFVLDASHELRTPLTSIQGFIEVLQLGAAKNEQQLNMALNSILIESQRLSKLVSQLLLLVKLEGNPSIELKEENINNIIQEVVPQLEILMKQRQLTIQFDEATEVLVNKDQIKQVIYNLVQNAINHTNESTGKIKIVTQRIEKENGLWVEVSIIDNGEGISKENIGQIFDRFYRADKHRSRRNGGYGLGLAIIKEIIYNHEGEIDVESEMGRGSTFRVRLKGL